LNEFDDHRLFGQSYPELSMCLVTLANPTAVQL